MNPIPPPDARVVCPRDGAPLRRIRTETPYHACSRCRGFLLPLAMAHDVAPLRQEILRRAESWPRSSFGCPLCGRAMHQAWHDGVEIDLCCHCEVVWLDRDEINRVSPCRQPTAKDQAREEAEAQAVDTGLDALNGNEAGVLDWLGDALGSLLS